MRILRIFFVLLILFPLFSGCSNKNNTADKTEAEPESSAVVAAQEQAAIEHRNMRQGAIRRQTARIAAGLDNRQLAAQVIISGIDGKGHLTDDMRMLLTECPAGGIMLFRYNLDADNDAIRDLITEAAVLVGALASTETIIPPFVGVDHEGGSVNRFRPGVANLPSAGFYFDMTHNTAIDSVIAQINSDSFNAGKTINGLGVNLNLAPVAEFLNDNNRDFLGERSYGPDPAFTAKAAAAFIAGMEQAGILCAIKHFPGSAGSDPHLFSSVLRDDKAALAELAAPFAALIRDNHARAIMVSHSAVPAWDGENIASLSPAVMGGWLRDELGFNGIIICDDFSMASARSPAAASGPVSEKSLKPETAAVLSLAAGADMVLVWPPDLRRTHRAIMAALDSGELSRERLREAAERIIFEKIRMRLVEREE